ncbi:hypothetical protein C4D60_Mb08t00270 [Musa balbisiana]|uniref:Uncharacterized protein n=1 Tax=Musa balbisiana TaxID=52838 RepID=A0A4S8K083_MUSBA|nr:hypothetical protein C4D60_Mb08t00270 [Musa balbisiana]
MECDRRKKGPADRMAYHDMGKCLLKSLTMDVIDLVIKLADLHNDWVTGEEGGDDDALLSAVLDACRPCGRHIPPALWPHPPTRG